MLLRDAEMELVSSTDLSPRLYARPRWWLEAYLALLLLLHRGAASLPLPTTAMQLSTQIGGVSRELLLHEPRAIAYTLLIARKQRRRRRGLAREQRRWPRPWAWWGSGRQASPSGRADHAAPAAE